MDPSIESQLKRMLQEDIGFGDITSQLLRDEPCTAHIIAKEDCILSGVQYVKYLFEMQESQVILLHEDGDTISKGDKVLQVSGLSKNIFVVERTALNLLTRMSGIATETRKLVDAVQKVNPNCRVAATRKTILRFFDKEAVVTGGGDPHRFRLDDMVLLKDNHVAILGIKESIRRAKELSFSKKIEIEVSTKEDALTAAELGVDIVMLDNMDTGSINETVRVLKKNIPHVLVEASGGITKENITEYAHTGVDIISLGYLTHSVDAVDMSLEVSV
jgi:nicotinate-nucleotide pyrophosphorylase (carboxylating)